MHQEIVSQMEHQLRVKEGTELQLSSITWEHRNINTFICLSAVDDVTCTFCARKHY